jgi:methionyl-tRNA formyltransferase
VKTVFFGTPPIAIPALETLSQISELVGVVCQPDRPAGRGLQQQEPAVKRWALERGLDPFQPTKVRDGQLAQWLAALSPDVAVVLAYGRILPQDVLDAPKRGCMNLHASLLPRHRGAAPIQWSILSGDSCTGISLMQMDIGLDSGPVYSQRSIPIRSDETTGSLTERLAQLAADVLRDDLARAVSGELTAMPQDASSITLAPPIRHADQLLDFTGAATALDCRIRALAPKPGAVCLLRNRRLKILASCVANEPTPGPPGSVSVTKGRIFVATAQGSLELLRLQLEGKAVQSARDIVNGRGIADGDRLDRLASENPV